MRLLSSHDPKADPSLLRDLLPLQRLRDLPGTHVVTPLDHRLIDRVLAPQDVGEGFHNAGRELEDRRGIDAAPPAGITGAEHED